MRKERITCTLFPALFIVSLLMLLSPQPALSQFDDKFDDMEKEFFKSQEEMQKDYKDFEQAAFEEFRRDVKAMWNDFVASTKKDWVEYSGDKTGRSVVDFEDGEVVVEVLVPKEEAKRNPEAVRERLEQELERLVVDRGKSRDYDVVVKPPPEEIAIDIPEAPAPPKKVIPPEPLSKTPVLKDQLKTKEGKPVTEENKKEFAKEIVKAKPVEKKVISTEKGEMVKAKVKFPLVPNHLRVRAEKHLGRVRKHAKRFDVDVPVAFAVIHTESYFNPKAKSHVPAYGLMQLVPRSGARDAYRYVYGKDKILSSDYLFDPDQNVELGCAYLGLLKNRYFKRVQNPQNALYCAIASYNTGAGNLSRSLTGNTRLSGAIDRINTMEPEDLYHHLRNQLPYEETRKYIKKVRDRMELYQEWR
jgi:membrane-bound lytic murein transglycosylase C